MKRMTQSEIERYLEESISQEVPSSVVDAFLDVIDYKNDAEANYIVETQNNNGVTFIKVRYSNGISTYAREDEHTITIDNENFRYQIDGYKNDFVWGFGKEQTGYRGETVNLRFDNNSWENKPGWILEQDEKVTIAQKGNNGMNPSLMDLHDNRTESKTLYDESGVEMARNSTISYYVTRRDSHRFETRNFNFSKPETRYENVTRRTSLATMENYITSYDMLGKPVDNKVYYYGLQTDRDLGRMTVCLPLDAEGHVRSVAHYNNLSEEDLETVIEKTPSPTREGLLGRYYPGMVKSTGRNI